jgi:hypothetical protein
MSPGLEKLVNQLDRLTIKIVSLDERMRHNENEIENLLQHERIYPLLDKEKDAHHTVWENFHQEKIRHEISSEAFGEDLEVARVEDVDIETDNDLQNTLKLIDSLKMHG